MAETLWTTPCPTEIDSVKFHQGIQHQCDLVLELERQYFVLEFHDVESYRCTYMASRSGEMHAAYGKLIDVGRSSWLAEIESQYRSYWANGGHDIIPLRHLMINFDDGPCYEFICGSFKVKDILAESNG